MKRLVFLALALVVLTCSLGFPVFATEVIEETEAEVVVAAEASVDLSTFNFSVTQLVSGGGLGTYYGSRENFNAVLYNSFISGSAVVLGCTSGYLVGVYWDDLGRLCYGRWENSLHIANAGVLGVYPMGSLNLGYSVSTKYFFSKALADSSGLHPESAVYAFDWETGITVVSSAYKHTLYQKKITDNVWSGSKVTVSNLDLSSVYTGTGLTSTNVYFPKDVDSIQWGVIPAGGTEMDTSGSDGDTTTSPYIYVSCPSTVTKGMPILPWAELQNAGDISGSILCFLSGHNSAYTKLTEATSGDNMWTLDCGRDETASTLTLTFMVDGRPDIYTTFHVSVLDPSPGLGGDSSDLPGSGTATEPPEPTYSGGDDADDFNDAVNDQKDDFDSSMDILEDFTRPDYEDIDPGFDDILDGDPINKVSEFFAEIFGNDYIKQVFFIAFLLAAISFIVFGKR